MLELPQFKTKVLFHNCKDKLDCVRQGQYCHCQMKASRKRTNGSSFSNCFSGRDPFRADQWAVLWVSLGNWGSQQSEGSGVDQILEGQQKIRGVTRLLRICVFLAAHHSLPAIIRVGQSRTLLGGKWMPFADTGSAAWKESRNCIAYNEDQAKPSPAEDRLESGPSSWAFSPQVRKLAWQLGQVPGVHPPEGVPWLGHSRGLFSCPLWECFPVFFC